jgi:WD40 repeat protein
VAAASGSWTIQGPVGSGTYLPPAGWHDGRAMVWDAASGKPHTPLRGAGGRVAWSLDGTTLATSGFGVRLWDGHTGEQRALLPTVISVRPMAWSPDGKTLASEGVVDQRWSTLLWDAAGHLRARLIGPVRSVSSSRAQTGG